jgi:hypothetical protein
MKDFELNDSKDFLKVNLFLIHFVFHCKYIVNLLLRFLTNFATFLTSHILGCAIAHVVGR